MKLAGVRIVNSQVMEPVRFYDSIAKMREAGVTSLSRLVQGKVLSGFLKKLINQQLFMVKSL